MNVIIPEVDSNPGFEAAAGADVCALVMIHTLGVALAAVSTVSALVNVRAAENVGVRPDGASGTAVAFFHVEQDALAQLLGVFLCTRARKVWRARRRTSRRH